MLVVPTLTNTASGTLTSLAGSGGTRTLTGTLVNAGAVNVPHDLLLTGVDASHPELPAPWRSRHTAPPPSPILSSHQ